MSDNLPEGWMCARLGDLAAKLVDGSHNPPRKCPAGVPMLSARNVDGGQIVLDEFRYISPEDFVTEHARTRVSPGDVLLTIVGSIGRVAVVPETTKPFALQRSVAVIHVPSMIPHFLARQLESARVQHLLGEAASGTAQKGVYLRSLAELELLIAPLAEQRRIVAKVEAFVAQVKAARERLAKVPRILKRFRQAVLAGACSGKLTEEWREEHPDVEPMAETIGRCEAHPSAGKTGRRKRSTVGLAEIAPPDDIPHGWVAHRVKNLVAAGAIIEFQDGNHGALYPRSADFGDSGKRFITARQVFDGDVLVGEAPFLSEQRASRLRIGFAMPGDLLLTHNATVGRVAILPLDAGECVVGTSVTYYRLRTNVIDPTFLMCFMQSPHWQDQLALVMEQTTRNQVSVRKQAELWVVLPPFSEQVEIVRRLSALSTLARAVEWRLIAATTLADKLSQAVLNKAFVGELVPTEAELASAKGSSYESASELISRLAAASVAHGATQASHPEPTGDPDSLR